MAWEVRAFLEDGGSPTVCIVDTLGEAKTKIQSILQEGFSIESEQSYAYYPSRVIKRAEAFKRE